MKEALHGWDASRARAPRPSPVVGTPGPPLTCRRGLLAARRQGISGAPPMRRSHAL